jgi:hypothetical protein
VPVNALNAEIARRDAEQRAQMQFAEGEVNETGNPFIQAGQELILQAMQGQQMQQAAAQEMAQMQQMPQEMAQAMPQEMPPQQPMV